METRGKTHSRGGCAWFIQSCEVPPSQAFNAHSGKSLAIHNLQIAYPLGSAFSFLRAMSGILMPVARKGRNTYPD